MLTTYVCSVILPRPSSWRVYFAVVFLVDRCGERTIRNWLPNSEEDFSQQDVLPNQKWNVSNMSLLFCVFVIKFFFQCLNISFARLIFAVSARCVSSTTWFGNCMTTMEGKLIILIYSVLIVVTLISPVVEAQGKKPPATFIFGDSLVDVGNNDYIFTLASANHKPYGIDTPDQVATGRFCNGKIIPDLVSKF